MCFIYLFRQDKNTVFEILITSAWRLCHPPRVLNKYVLSLPLSEPVYIAEVNPIHSTPEIKFYKNSTFYTFSICRC